MPTTRELVRRRYLEVGVSLLVVVVLAACSSFNRPWGKAYDYVDGLRCGMPESELRGYSERYRRLQIVESEGLEYLVARKGNTQVRLWLEPTGLIAYQITWVYPLTNFASEPRTDLCASGTASGPGSGGSVHPGGWPQRVESHELL